MKLPLGKHFLSGIAFNNRSINLTDKLLKFETPENKIYYLGDINIILSLDFNDTFTNGLIGALEYDNRSKTPPAIWIDNKIKNAKFYFNSLFPL